MRTPLLVPVLLLALTACGQDSGTTDAATASTPSAAAATSAAPPTPVRDTSPTAKRQGTVIDDSAVAGVPLGTPAAEAERRLVAALGPARKVALPGCNGERGFWLSWETLTVVVSDEYPGEYGGGIVLAGWTVIGGPSRHTFALPFDVLPGTPVREVLSRVPEAKGMRGEGPTDGQFLVHTAKMPDLSWLSGSFDDSGVVDDVSFRNPATCD